MEELKKCPRCGVMPEVFEKKTVFKSYLCSISCPHLGCPYYYPIVITSFVKKKAKEKAIQLWNKRLEKPYENPLH